ncbi:MAG: hypothetical protein A2675_01835 [Candidatus Yonathbacteria bacterium RIFCSPHIGHO2_01_FULL_51_10]|uniref:VTT domain-containing protein n=1 Tax=Candidatus Yonathbacteria bacterium RIFCSPHIGHO2_01_FULL_51_10 TaxID=1802723 RepID=A0A1G2S9Y1_9BACT|nr:MAG: hypothetical protein A2675_01835 [Candidatus Yonathbacteria bacterium RIFCSPHIGHO2_01_FULL_51_10]
MNETTIETILAGASYLGIFLMMIANGAISLPSSQLLFIVVGYFIGQGSIALVPAVVAGAAGNMIGNMILYELARRKGIEYITRFKVFPLEILRRTEAAFRKRGAWFVFVGKLLPALKVFVPIPAGVGKMHRGLFAFIMFVATSIWVLPFIAVGYFFGKSRNVFGAYAFVLALIAVIVVAIFYRYLKSAEVERELEVLEDDAPARDRK